MTERREASCRCGRVRIVCHGPPVRVSVCHCLDCQRRSGSAFAFQARWPDDRIELTGEPRAWTTTGDSGNAATFRFCPTCGTAICYTSEGLSGLTAVPVGLFADPAFPPPDYSVYEARKHPWLALTGEAIHHFD